jgi:hypothetical protein
MSAEQYIRFEAELLQWEIGNGKWERGNRALVGVGGA